MKTIAFALATIVVLLTARSHALIELGVGFSSATSGRQVPALSLGVGTNSWLVSAQSVGTKSEYSYLSAYVLNVLRPWTAGKILNGDVKAGFGIGLFYTERGFDPSLSTPLERKSDFGGGPAFQAHWYCLSPGYVGIDALFGLKDISRNLTLAYQDMVLISLGMGW